VAKTNLEHCVYSKGTWRTAGHHQELGRGQDRSPPTAFRESTSLSISGLCPSGLELFKNKLVSSPWVHGDLMQQSQGSNTGVLSQPLHSWSLTSPVLTAAVTEQHHRLTGPAQ
jgi:hypothetical protein